MSDPKRRRQHGFHSGIGGLVFSPRAACSSNKATGTLRRWPWFHLSRSRPGRGAEGIRPLPRLLHWSERNGHEAKNATPRTRHLSELDPSKQLDSAREWEGALASSSMAQWLSSTFGCGPMRSKGRDFRLAFGVVVRALTLGCGGRCGDSVMKSG